MSTNESITQQEHLEFASISDGNDALVAVSLVEQNFFFGNWEGLAVDSEFHGEFGVAWSKVELTAFFGLKIVVN